MDKVTAWEYRLRQFIDIATKWTIQTIKNNSKSSQNPFSDILWPFIENGRKIYDGFEAEIRNNAFMVANIEAFGRDIKARFLPMIEKYISWHHEHQNEIAEAGFGQYDPYQNMISLAIRTKDQLNTLFPANTTTILRKSFLCSLSEFDKERIFYELVKEKFIQDTEIKVWLSSLSGNEVHLPEEVGFIKWSLKNRKGAPHKGALRELLKLINPQFKASLAPLWFVDVKGNPITLTKPKKDEYSNYINTLEKIVGV